MTSGALDKKEKKIYNFIRQILILWGVIMTKITLKVEGMMCPKCEAHMNDCVKSNFKVKCVESSHKEMETVIISKNHIDRALLQSVIEEKTGYKVTEIFEEETEKKGFFASLFGKK